MRAFTPAIVALLVLTMARPTPAESQEESFETSDGVAILADYYAPPGKEPATGVVLVHMYSRSRSDWADFAADLQKAGHAVLALDLRGHGKSTRRKGESLDWRTFGGPEWLAVTADIRAAIDHLLRKKEVDAKRVFVIGASVGANLTLRCAADEAKGKETVRGIALLSPGENYCGVESMDALERYGSRRIFLAAGEDDPEACADTRRLAERAQDPGKVVKIYPSAGHGTQMFGRDEPKGDLATSLKAWLAEKSN